MKRVVCWWFAACVLVVRGSPMSDRRDTPIVSVDRLALPVEEQIKLFPELVPVFKESQDLPCHPYTNHRLRCKSYESAFHLISLDEFSSFRRQIADRDVWIYIDQTNSWTNPRRNLWLTSDGRPARNPLPEFVLPQSNRPPGDSLIKFPPYESLGGTTEPPKVVDVDTRVKPQGWQPVNELQTTSRPETTAMEQTHPGGNQQAATVDSGTSLEQPEGNGTRLVADSVLETIFKIRQLCEDVSAGCWENSVISPLSINSIFALLLSGSSGRTASELRSFLGYPEDVAVVEAAYNELVSDVISRFTEGENMRLRVANRLFLFNTQLDAQFEAKLERNKYGSAARFDKADAHATDKINEWVANQTNNKINQVIERLDRRSKLVAVNTVYFKGQWLEPFFAEFTREAEFHVTEEETIKVLMMADEMDVGYVENADLKCKMIVLPYKDPKLAMYLVLPSETNGLMQLEPKLNSQVLNDLIKSTTKKFVKISLPKFRVSQKLNLKGRLQQLDVQELFTLKADLSRMIPNGGVSLDEAVHHSFVQVSEGGTEAAGATVAFGTRIAAPRFQFTADHPFLFFIRDASTGIVYFYGRVVRPEQPTN